MKVFPSQHFTKKNCKKCKCHNKYKIYSVSFFGDEEIGGKKITSKIEMFPLDKEGNSTVILYNNIIFDKPINDNFFTTRNMKQLK